MANIKQTPSTQARLGKTGHDLSHRFIFSSAVGQLLPIYVDELIPGDHVKISADMFTRTVPLETPPFTRVTEHIDYFFVPMQQLYTFFGDFITGVDDVQSSLVQAGNTMRINCTPYTFVKDVCNELFALRGSADEFGVPADVNAYRLLDYLGYSYNFKSVLSAAEADIPQYEQHLNLWRLAAYQKIFFDYYRLGDWTANNRFAYNLDGAYYNAGKVAQGSLTQMLKMRYRPWKKDYYTNVLPSPLMAGNNINAMPPNPWNNSFDFSDVRQWLTNADYETVDPTGSIIDSSDPQQAQASTVAINSSGLSAPFDNVASISTAFAIRKLLEITRRAAKHYDAQILAHFGVKVPRGLAGEVYHLGSQSSVLQIGDVVSTAQAGTGENHEPLGSLAGKGFGSMNGNGCDFTADCHGIIMAIYSAVPESDYIHKGIDRQITYLTRYDWYQPELDNLGMQPVWDFDFDYSLGGNAGMSGTPLAWQYNHFENKQKLDQVHGCFANSRYSDWVTVRNYQLSWNYYRDLYIDPSYLDSITAVNYLAPDFQDGTFATDPLLHDLYFKSYKTSVMSTYGLESL